MDKMNVKERVKAYKLDTRVRILIILFIVFVLSLVAYYIPFFRKNEVSANILLALFTSVLVSIFTSIIDIRVDYNKRLNDEFLVDMYKFGIATLNRNKKEMLHEMLKECDKTIWISGYRLILTRDIKNDIAASVVRGADVTAVICPPWTEAFRMVYGENEKIMDNYLDVFHAIYRARISCGRDGEEHDDEFMMLFINKPIFSDTYRVDQNLITGPYMHNNDPEYHKMMAKDFFSYCIVKDSDLYNVVDGEFRTLCKEAIYRLDWRRFQEVYDKVEASDLREVEKSELLQGICVKM